MILILLVILDNAKGDASIIARQKEIAEKFDTYSEISPSGMGSAYCW